MRSIPKITKNLLIVNVLAFIVTLLLESSVDLGYVFGLHFFMASDFHIYQLFTYMFLHAGFEHLFFNMFALWMFGCVMENIWGPRRFLTYYLACGIGAGLFQEAAQLVEFYMLASNQIPGVGWGDLSLVARNSATVLNMWTTVGASGAIYGILLAFGMTLPEERMFIFPLPVPIKAKWFVVGYAVLEIAMALTRHDNVAHLAHLGGMVVGFFIIRHWMRRARGGYGYRQEGLFGRLGQWWKGFSASGTSRKQSGPRTGGGGYAGANPDWEYNARKKVHQEEIDRILDKIRKSGYDSLTREEKQKLFDSSNMK